jgi:hypothetical protein
MVHVPGAVQWLYAISHRHDGDVWFATVGKNADRSPSGLERPQEERRDPAMAFVHLFAGPTRRSPCCH